MYQSHIYSNTITVDSKYHHASIKMLKNKIKKNKGNIIKFHGRDITNRKFCTYWLEEWAHPSSLDP